MTVNGPGGACPVRLATSSGYGAVLPEARSSEPRRFGNPIAALSLLRDLVITFGQFDASDWNPDEKVVNSRDDARAQVLREAHEAGAYVKWLASEIQESIDDPRPSVPHDEVMSRMDARIAGHKTAGGKRA